MNEEAIKQVQEGRFAGDTQQGPALTIADAIEDARFLRANPDCLVDGGKSKQIIDTLLSALERSRCYLNAVSRGQEVFVLVQQDRAAPIAIDRWAAEAGDHGGHDKSLDAFKLSARWRAQPADRTKWPD